MLDIANQLLTRHLLSRYSVMLMNGKAFINLNPSFLGLLMLKNWKVRFTHKQFSFGETKI